MISLRKNKSFPIGVHLTEHSISLVQFSPGPDGGQLPRFAIAELPASNGEPVEKRDQFVAASLRKLRQDHGFEGHEVVSCLATQDLFVQNVRLPQLPAEEIDQALKWEAAERLPYPIEDAEIRHLTAGLIRQDAEIRQEVILLACRRSVVERQVRMLEAAKLRPLAIDIEPCATVRSMLPVSEANPAQYRRAILKFGSVATTVTLTDGPRIAFLKSIPTGGREFDQAVAQHLDLPLPEAARIRREVTQAERLDPEDDIHRSVVDALRESLETITSEIDLCLRYYRVTFRGRGPYGAVLCGQEAAPWLAEYLSHRLAMGCTLANPFENETTNASPTPIPRPWRWTTAAGLSRKHEGAIK